MLSTVGSFAVHFQVVAPARDRVHHERAVEAPGDGQWFGAQAQQRSLPLGPAI